eukprot:UN21316
MIDLDEHKGTEGKIDRQKVMFVLYMSNRKTIYIRERTAIRIITSNGKVGAT